MRDESTSNVIMAVGSFEPEDLFCKGNKERSKISPLKERVMT